MGLFRQSDEELKRKLDQLRKKREAAEARAKLKEEVRQERMRLKENIKQERRRIIQAKYGGITKTVAPIVSTAAKATVSGIKYLAEAQAAQYRAPPRRRRTTRKKRKTYHRRRSAAPKPAPLKIGGLKIGL